MKNKKLLYILIPCTLLLWGMIIYKIFSVTGGDDDSTFKSAAFTPGIINKTLSDTFSIHPSYRDPFLGTANKKIISTNENRAPKKPITPAIIKTTIPFPQITYGGLIKNTQSNKQLVMVQINGQSNIMKVGDIVSEVELTKIFRDSIEITFFKEKKFIVK